MDHKTWTDMFILTLPLLEKILRPIFVYAFLVIGLRLAGKRELAQLNPFDLEVLLTLSNTVQNAIIGEDNSVTGGLIGAATLLLVNYFVVRYLYSHERLDRVVEGRVEVLIENGKLHQDQLRRDLITLPELEAAAHRQGFCRWSERNLHRKKCATGNCWRAWIRCCAKWHNSGRYSRPRQPSRGAEDPFSARGSRSQPRRHPPAPGQSRTARRTAAGSAG